MELPFFPNPCDVYERLRPLGTAVLLDSGGNHERGRYDIVAAAPDPQYSLVLMSSEGKQDTREKIRHWAAQATALCDKCVDQATKLPFNGGYIGYLSYELGRRLQPRLEPVSTSLPLAVAHFYPWAVVQDNAERRSYLVGSPSDVHAISAQITARLKAPIPTDDRRAPFRLLSKFKRPWNLERFDDALNQTKKLIEAGDCYQINLGQPFSAPYQGSLVTAYRQLREIARAPYSGLFPVDSHNSILAFSPERFLEVCHQRVETRPIKGTRPRYPDIDNDEKAADELLRSTKERAENLMIVDLLRNDLGRFCTPGSISVDELFSLESYETVHHLVSSVSGQLKSGISALDVLLGSLPGGSITGAPKLRAMQIIDELEHESREAWCGTAFYLSQDGRLDSNILIRSFFSHGRTLCAWAGGGLVHDSQSAMEFQEQHDKIGRLLAVLEATRMTS
ncbi:MAG: anthranilate synthase component I family protein [Pseudomonadota bacterium]